MLFVSLNSSQKGTHLTPALAIVEDARHPTKYRMLVSMVDVIFADVAQPDQARIVGLNAHHFLKHNGHVVISIKASCIDSTAPAEAVFAEEVKKLQKEMVKPREQLTLEPYERDHCILIGVSGAPRLVHYHSLLTPCRPTSDTNKWKRPQRLGLDAVVVGFSVVPCCDYLSLFFARLLHV